MKTATLRNQANKAPKFVIEMVQAPGFYINEAGDNVTENTKGALQYSVGFDNENMKLQYWTAAFNTPLQIKYL